MKNISNQPIIENDDVEIAGMVNHALQALNATSDYSEVITIILTYAQQLFNVQSVSIGVIESKQLVYRYVRGDGSDKIIGMCLPYGIGIGGWVIQHRQPVLSNDIQNDDRFSTIGDERTGLVTTAMLCAPIQFNGEVWGTIQAINPSQRQFSDIHLDMMVQFAEAAGNTLHRALELNLLLETNSRQREWLRESTTPIFITDANGIIDVVNKRAELLIGYGKHQLIGKPIDDIHEESFIEHVMAQRSENQDEPYVITTKIICSDGRTVPIELHVKHMVDHTIQWIYRDISRQIMLEKMRNDLTVMLLHDLKNPLSNIMNSLELLEEELPTDGSESIAGVMHNIATQSSQWLHHLIHSLLDINRIEAGTENGTLIVEREVVDAQEMIYSLEVIMQARLEANQIQLSIDVDDNLPLASISRDMIERVILNLMDNALKFSESGDTISLTAVPFEDDMIKLSVSDQGPGVHKEFREAIFDKYYKSPDTRANGMGLGLAFCALTVEAHGGRIWVDDAVGGGARFNLTVQTADETV